MKQATEKDLRKAAATIRQAVATAGATASEVTTRAAVRDLAEWYKRYFGITITPAQKDSLINRVISAAED